MASTGSSVSTTSVQNPYAAYRGLRFEEDTALENQLRGLTVPNAQGTKHLKVDVFFQDPQREEHTTTYPYIMIAFLRTRRDPAREHRGWALYGTELNTANPLADPNGAWTQIAIPLMLDYQVTVAARVFQHDVIINDILGSTRLPYRFGQVTCPSGTVRRLNVLNGGPRAADSLDQDSKRIFRKIWDVEISSEQGFSFPTAGQVETVDLQVTPIP